MTDRSPPALITPAPTVRTGGGRPARPRRAAWTAIACAVLALGLSGCATPPPPAPVKYNAVVVLLDNGDGTTGKVHVTGAGGMTVLDRAREATFVGSPSGNTFDLDESQLQKDFAPALAASPQRARSFLIYFEFGSTKLTPESRAELPKILAEIGKRPAPDMSVIGHTDTVGDDAANETLGLGRAKVVADMMVIGMKLDPTKVALESHGKRNLLVPTPDKTVEPRNRRVEVTVR